MATSVMQSISVSPATGVISRTRPSQLIPRSFLPRVQRSTPLGMGVSCKAKGQDGQNEELPVPETPATPAQPIPTSAPKKPKLSTQFSDVMAFSGPAPERINGRLAMIGFVAAIGVELASGADIFAQISNGGIPWFLGTSVLLSLASLIPLFKGVSVESKSERIMSSDAELLNGRWAMLGLVALALTEFMKGGALV